VWDLTKNMHLTLVVNKFFLKLQLTKECSTLTQGLNGNYNDLKRY